MKNGVNDYNERMIALRHRRDGKIPHPLHNVHDLLFRVMNETPRIGRNDATRENKRRERRHALRITTASFAYR